MVLGHLCIRATYARRKGKSKAGYIRWPDRRQCTAKDMNIDSLLVIQVTVSSQDLTFELFLVVVPKFGCLSVQRACTVEQRCQKSVTPESDLYIHLLIRLAKKRLQTEQDSLDVIDCTPFVL